MRTINFNNKAYYPYIQFEMEFYSSLLRPSCVQGGVGVQSALIIMRKVLEAVPGVEKTLNKC